MAWKWSWLIFTMFSYLPPPSNSTCTHTYYTLMVITISARPIEDRALENATFGHSKLDPMILITGWTRYSYILGWDCFAISMWRKKVKNNGAHQEGLDSTAVLWCPLIPTPTKVRCGTFSVPASRTIFQGENLGTCLQGTAHSDRVLSDALTVCPTIIGKLSHLGIACRPLRSHSRNCAWKHDGQPLPCSCCSEVLYTFLAHTITPTALAGPRKAMSGEPTTTNICRVKNGSCCKRHH